MIDDDSSNTKYFMLPDNLTIASFFTHFFKELPICDSEAKYFSKFADSERRITYEEVQQYIGKKYIMTYFRNEGIEYKTPEEIYDDEHINNIFTRVTVAMIYLYLKENNDNTTGIVLGIIMVYCGSVFKLPDMYSLASKAFRSSIFYARESIRKALPKYKWNPDFGYYLESQDIESDEYMFDETEYNVSASLREKEISEQHILFRRFLEIEASKKTDNRKKRR